MPWANKKGLVFTRGRSEDFPFALEGGAVWDGVTFTGTSPGSVPFAGTDVNALDSGTDFPTEMGVTYLFAAMRRVQKWTYSGTGISYVASTPDEDPVTWTVPDFSVDFEFPAAEVVTSYQILFLGASRDISFVVHVDPIPAVDPSQGDTPGFFFGARISQEIANRKNFYPLFIVRSSDLTLSTECTLLASGDPTPMPPVKPTTPSALQFTLEIQGGKTFNVPVYDSATFHSGSAWTGLLKLKPSDAGYFAYNGVYGVADGRMTF